MLKHLLAASITLALVVCAASIGLEAVGLLFHFGQRAPAQGTDPPFALIVEVDPREVPSEMEPDPPQLVVDGDSKRTDVQDRAGHDGHEGERSEGERSERDRPEGKRPEDEQLGGALGHKLGRDASAKAAALLPEVERERPVQEPKAYAAGVIAAAGGRPDCNEPCLPKPVPQPLPKSLSSELERPPSRVAGTERRKAVRSTPRGYRSLGWPVLDWLDAALGSALASDPRPAPAGRHAAL